MQKIDFDYNSAIVYPVMICVDTSENVDEDNLRKAENFIRTLLETCSNSNELRYSIDLSIITFDEFPLVLQKFTRCCELCEKGIPEYHFQSSGDSALGEAVCYCFERLEQRILYYNRSGCEYIQPTLFVLSSGHPSGKDMRQRFAAYTSAVAIGRKKWTNKSWRTIAVFCADEHDSDGSTCMSVLSPFYFSDHVDSIDSSEIYKRLHYVTSREKPSPYESGWTSFVIPT